MPVKFSDSATGCIDGFVNSLAEQELQLLLLQPAPRVSQSFIEYVLANLTGFEATHLEFPVQRAEDWREIPSLPEHWYVNRYVVYGTHI